MKVRIPRPIRKAVKLALSAPKANTCAACHEMCGVESDIAEPTPCCHYCAQELLAMLADYVESLRKAKPDQ